MTVVGAGAWIGTGEPTGVGEVCGCGGPAVASRFGSRISGST
jgi:hypothetical protein